MGLGGVAWRGLSFDTICGSFLLLSCTGWGGGLGVAISVMSFRVKITRMYVCRVRNASGKSPCFSPRVFQTICICRTPHILLVLPLSLCCGDLFAHWSIRFSRCSSAPDKFHAGLYLLKTILRRFLSTHEQAGQPPKTFSKDEL